MKAALKYGIAENFPVVRWIFAVMVVAFTAIVSVYKYIDISDMAATSFSSLETVFLLLTDSINIIFIYLPLYLFIVCGFITNENFGAAGIVKYQTRKKWLTTKTTLLLLNTAVFFVLLLAVNFAVAYRVFPFADSWSSGFISFRVMMGQSALDFTEPPLITIGMSIAASFLLYLLCGTVSLLTALLTEKEEFALFSSLLFGIAAGLVNMTFIQNDFTANILRCGVLIIAAAAFIGLCFARVNTKDFAG